MNNKIKLAGLLISVLALSACSQSKTTEAEASFAASSIESLNGESSATDGMSIQSTSFVPSVSNVITPEDTLDINVFKVPDLSIKQLKVESSGLISLPLIGAVKVTGLTITQAEQQITQRLKEYMQDPKVTVIRTDKAITNRVTIEGAVIAPGVFPIKGNLSFLQAVAMAQGVTDLADSKSVLLYRDGGQHVVNLDLIRTGQIPDPKLRGDDRIVVLKDSGKVRNKKVLDVIPILTSPITTLFGLGG